MSNQDTEALQVAASAESAAFAALTVVSRRFAHGGPTKHRTKQFKLATKLAETARALNESIVCEEFLK